MTDFVRDFHIHFTRSTKANELYAACGKKDWEFITDVKEKVTCPECKKEVDFKRAWDDAIFHLMTDNSALNLTQSGRVLHLVCEQARAGL